jgi:type VI secretion system protein ImpK
MAGSFSGAARLRRPRIGGHDDADRDPDYPNWEPTATQGCPGVSASDGDATDVRPRRCRRAPAGSVKLRLAVQTSIGVFGEELLLWACLLRQSPQRPPADHVYRQANLLLDELRASKLGQSVPVQAADDGMFAIAALLDEIGMALPDLRPLWAAQPLQATRWMTNNAGVEFFDRLARVRQGGPKSVLATYVAVLGMGFQGRFGLPGADRYGLAQLRRQLMMEVGVDPDRDWQTGVLRPARPDTGPADTLPKVPWHQSLGLGRALAFTTLAAGALGVALVLYSKLA